MPLCQDLCGTCLCDVNTVAFQLIEKAVFILKPREYSVEVMYE